MNKSVGIAQLSFAHPLKVKLNPEVDTSVFVSNRFAGIEVNFTHPLKVDWNAEVVTFVLLIKKSILPLIPVH